MSWVRDKTKYVRISIDLTQGEYRKLKNRVEERGCFISFYVRNLISMALLDGDKAIERSIGDLRTVK